MYARYVKRALDVALSAAGIVVLCPVLAGVSVAVKVSGDGSVLFRQRRVGKDKDYFTIYKFETMTKDTPADLATDQIDASQIRYTGVGEFLRKTSLNELPQLLNILKGDMSVVGPRPALWNQFELIEMRERAGVHRVRPGLTGWAQVNGRDTIPDERKVEYDREYVDNLSFLMDAKCFLKTFSTLADFADNVVEGGPKAAANTKREMEKMVR